MVDAIISRDLAMLHPAFRPQVERVIAKLEAGGSPLQVFEAWRSPIRQRLLAEQPSHVTNALPWQSAHQYGLAVDFVLKRPGKHSGWSWKVPPAEWRKLAVAAASEGLFIPSPGWDPGHVQSPLFDELRPIIKRFMLLA